MEITAKLKSADLFVRGYYLKTFTLDPSTKKVVEREDWDELNEIFTVLTSKDGKLFQFLQRYCEFNSVEFIISIRDSENEWEEDGIWHDDGSRVFAFSLSLTLEEIEGGNLGFRKKNSNEMELISTPLYGDIILFLTGIYGYEHKTHRVERGKRIVIAGWCS